MNDQVYFGGFGVNDGTVNFYSRINCFLKPHFHVLDIGAGRGSWFARNGYSCRNKIRFIKDKVENLIAVDVDPAVLDNESVHDSFVVEQGCPLPFEDSSFDVIIADYVLEHIDDPAFFHKEIDRLLKPGGLFAARTPHKFSYVAIAAMLIKNRLHSRVISVVQPSRVTVDIFPTCYKMNTLSDLNKIFNDFEEHSFIFRTEPSYYFGNKLIYTVLSFLHRIMPGFFSGNIFCYKIKKYL
jgi:SAM-dependent methyltransferase